MATKRAKRSKAKTPTVTVRFANEGHPMAKKKKRAKKRKTNPANPARRRPAKRRASSHRRAARRSNPSNPRRSRRRRNPSGTFSDRAMKLAGGALATIASGVIVTLAVAKAPVTWGKAAEFGIPAAAFLTGAALAKSHPMIGGGVALGAFTPFVLPLASKVLTETSGGGAAKTAAGIGRAFRSMRAVDMGAVDMGAIDYR